MSDHSLLPLVQQIELQLQSAVDSYFHYHPIVQHQYTLINSVDNEEW